MRLASALVGHRVPAYRLRSNAGGDGDDTRGEGDGCEREDEWVVAESADEAAGFWNTATGRDRQAGEYTLEQDDDVLDTWFSPRYFADGAGRTGDGLGANACGR